MKRHLPPRSHTAGRLRSHTAGSSPIGDRPSFLQVLLAEDLDELSCELGLAPAELSKWRGRELARVGTLLGKRPAERDLLDEGLFEQHRTAP